MVFVLFVMVLSDKDVSTIAFDYRVYAVLLCLTVKFVLFLSWRYKTSFFVLKVPLNAIQPTICTSLQKRLPELAASLTIY